MMRLALGRTQRQGETQHGEEKVEALAPVVLSMSPTPQPSEQPASNIRRHVDAGRVDAGVEWKQYTLYCRLRARPVCFVLSLRLAWGGGSARS